LNQGLFLEKVFPNFPKFFQKYFSKNLEKLENFLEKLEKFGKFFLEKLEKHFSKNSPCKIFIKMLKKQYKNTRKNQHFCMEKIISCYNYKFVVLIYW